MLDGIHHLARQPLARAQFRPGAAVEAGGADLRGPGLAPGDPGAVGPVHECRHALGGAGGGNVLSGNAGSGLRLTGSFGSNGINVQGNLIGIGANGTTALGNLVHGVRVTNIAEGTAKATIWPLPAKS